MSRWVEAPRYAPARRIPSLGAGVAFVGVVVVAAALYLKLQLLLPAALVMPAFSAVGITIAAVLALIAWLSHADRRAKHVTAWDLAGGAAFIGIAAGTMTRPEQAVQLFDQAVLLLTP